MPGVDYHRVILQALCTQSMGELAKAAHEVLGMPVVVTDAAFIVRAKYPDEPLDDEQWDANVLNRQIEPRFVRTFTDDDHFTHHDEAGKAILIDWGHYANAPRLTSVVKVGDASHGYFAALATGVDVQPWHYEAADAIGSAFAVLMGAGSSARFARSGLASPALYALLDGPARSKANLKLLPPEFFEQNRPPYMLFCARTRNPHNAPLEMYLGNELAQYFEHATQTVYEGDLYLLASAVEPDARGSVRGKLFAEELCRQNLQCGASRPFTSLEDIRVRAWEASSALDEGALLGHRGPMFHYEDYLVDVACRTLADALPERALEHEGLASLRRHDEANGTSYLETLETFYALRFDKKATCEKLRIHRNTLQYRLDRIEDMLGGDAEGLGVLCALYFALEDYRARVVEAGRPRRRGKRAGAEGGAR